MGLSVRTVHGKTFRRAGLEFGPEPTIVADDVLDAKTDGPTVRERLLAEPMLACVEAKAAKVEEPKPAKAAK